MSNSIRSSIKNNLVFNFSVSTVIVLMDDLLNTVAPVEPELGEIVTEIKHAILQGSAVEVSEWNSY